MRENNNSDTYISVADNECQSKLKPDSPDTTNDNKLKLRKLQACTETYRHTASCNLRSNHATNKSSLHQCKHAMAYSTEAARVNTSLTATSFAIILDRELKVKCALQNTLQSNSQNALKHPRDTKCFAWCSADALC
jgi:hypothetical protein